MILFTGLRWSPNNPTKRLFVMSLIILFYHPLVHAQSAVQPAAQPPATPCDHVTAVGGVEAVTYDLQQFCDAVLAAAQNKPYSSELINLIVADKNVEKMWQAMLPHKEDNLKRAFAIRQLQLSASGNLLSALTQNRPDQQTTAAQTVNAATSLVQKTAGPELISLAIEAGSLTESTSGNVATLSANLEGGFYTLVGQDPICFESCGKLRPLLGAINASATFTLNQQSTSTTTATTPATSSSPLAGTALTIPTSVGKLTGVSAKFVIHNKFDPHSSAFRKNWMTAVKGSNYDTLAGILLQKNGEISAAILKAEDAASFQPTEVNFIKVVLSNVQELPGDYDTYATSVYNAAKLSFTDLSNYLQAYTKLSTEWQSIRSQAAGVLATVQYSYSKPANQPETHTVTLVLSYAPKNSTKNGLLTANFGASIYGNTIPSGANYGRVQYGQASAEFDRILFSPSSTGPVNLNLAAYWQYQPNPSVLNITQSNLAPGTTIDAPTQVLVGTSGSLWVGQAQLSYKNHSGLSIPLGVKWSNKTELVTGSKIGAQIGISYDFSFLSNILNPSK